MAVQNLIQSGSCAQHHPVLTLKIVRNMFDNQLMSMTSDGKLQLANDMLAQLGTDNDALVK